MLLTIRCLASKVNCEMENSGLNGNVMNDKIVQLTDGNFSSDVLGASGLVLVYFWAEWSGPCKMFASVFEGIAKEYQGQLTIGRLNTDQNSATGPKYGVRGIPTLLLFSEGSLAHTKVGVLSKTELEEFLNENIRRKPLSSSISPTSMSEEREGLGPGGFRRAFTIVDYRSEDEGAGYEYYDLRGYPVRTVLGDDGDTISADALDSETGELLRDVTMMSQVETDPLSEQISKEEFYTLCEALVSEKKLDGAKKA